MEWIIENWSFLLRFVMEAIALVVSFMVFVKTRSLSKSISAGNLVRVNTPVLRNQEEVKEEMIKPMSLEQAEKAKPAAQSFSEYKKDYVLNSATNELEVLPNPVNIQAKIDSYLECALDRVLERLTPKVVEERDTIQEDFQNSVDDLASLGEAMEVAEEWRDRLELPASYNMAQIYAAVDERAQKLKKSLSDFGKKSEVKNNEVQKDVE